MVYAVGDGEIVRSRPGCFELQPICSGLPRDDPTGWLEPGDLLEEHAPPQCADGRDDDGDGLADATSARVIRSGGPETPAYPKTQ